MMNLTAGAILIMLSSEENKNTGLKPVLQVTDLKLLTPDRYLMTLSDGTFSYDAMLATLLSELVRSQRLQKGSVVQISLFINSVIQNRRVITVIDLEPLAKYNLIDDPMPLGLKGDASSSMNANNSVFSKFAETTTGIFEEQVKELVRNDVSLRHAYEVEKKARGAAEQKLIVEQEVIRQLHEELDFIKNNGPATLTASLHDFFEAVYPAACDVGNVETLIALRDKHPDIELGGFPSADWAKQELAAKKKIVIDLFLAKVWGGLNSDLIWGFEN